MTDPRHYDIIVIGGGPAGLTASCLLGARGFSVLCIDRENADTTTHANYDGRTIAISHGSQLVMEKAGVWDGMKPHGCPILNIKILDGNSPVLMEFDTAEVDNIPFGHIVEMRHIRASLYARVEKMKNVTLLAPANVTKISITEKNASVETSDGKKFTAKLLIGADGRNSALRKHLKISTHGWSYGQNAIVAIIEHEHPHNNVAIEHFKSHGPFAILPMQDAADGAHRSSLVWTLDNGAEKEFLECDEDVFNAALAARFPAHYGAVKLASKRFTYPLGLIHSHEYVAPRVALIADAAHGMHPIAGQGLNMGMRDIDALAGILSDAQGDIGALDTLKIYERARRFDNMTMMAGTDALNRLFSNKLPLVGPFRRLGVRLVNKSPTAKKFFMHQAMGLKYGSKSGIA